MSDRPTCGRCGVYRHLHPTARCANPRLSFWWDRHSIRRHILGGVWLSLSDRHRFTLAARYSDRHPDAHWCELVDAAYLDDKRGDFGGEWGCLCDVPVPTDAGPTRPDCYCTPAATTTGI